MGLRGNSTCGGPSLRIHHLRARGLLEGTGQARLSQQRSVPAVEEAALLLALVLHQAAEGLLQAPSPSTKLCIPNLTVMKRGKG